MSDLILRSNARRRVALHTLSTAVVDFARRAGERVRREQTGQDMVEYAGVILVVSVIIAALVTSGIGTTIANGATSLVSHVLNGTSGSGGGGTPAPGH